MNARIESIAYALPSTVVTNEQLRREFPGWDFDRLEKRTGVLQRHIAGDGETALDLAEIACRSLHEEGAFDWQNVGGIIFVTETPDYPIPSNACLLHGRLELPQNVMALDINMGCSGYLYGLEVARNFIRSGSVQSLLLVTADTYSSFINPQDRATRVLFGDGAAVSLITAADDGSGIIDLCLGADGKYYDRFMVPAGGARTPINQETKTEKTDKSGNIRCAENIVMDGFGVLSFFNSVIPGEVKAILKANELAIDDIDLFVFHQASQVALDSISRALGISETKMVNELARTGNLVSASIPVSLKMNLDKGGATAGDLVLLCGFGVGLSWGTAVARI